MELGRFMPAEIGDVVTRARIGPQRLGHAERTDRRRQRMVPRAGIGVHLFVAECVIVIKPHTGQGLKQGDAVDRALWLGDMLFKAPA